MSILVRRKHTFTEIGEAHAVGIEDCRTVSIITRCLPYELTNLERLVLYKSSHGSSTEDGARRGCGSGAKTTVENILRELGDFDEDKDEENGDVDRQKIAG